MSEVDPREGVTFAIARRKLTHYLLDLNSRDGRGKAKFFLAEGFNAETLERALLDHVISGTLERVRRTEWGLVMEIRGPIRLTSGRGAIIRAAWQIDDNAPSVAKLLTAYLD